MRVKHVGRVAVSALAVVSLAVACDDDDDTDVDVEDPLETVVGGDTGTGDTGTTETTAAIGGDTATTTGG